MQTRLQTKTQTNTCIRLRKPRGQMGTVMLNRLLMNKCLDLYALVDNYESKPRKTLPQAVRHGVWVRTCGRVYERTCPCCDLNSINVFNFHCAHIEPKSKGGSNHVYNLRAVCAECNLSMGTHNLHDFQAKLRGPAQHISKN
jgi:5-methylcytosine-specific restriction endonuclease McrA